MSERQFYTDDGLPVPTVTGEQMREVDRIAVEDFDLGILQMMENAGRNLAQNVMDMLAAAKGEVTVLAGSGGNGGGGICCARHLHNHGFKVRLILDRDASELGGTAGRQLRILRMAGVESIEPVQAEEAIARADLVVDALIGYGLRGAPRGRAAELIEMCNERGARVLALDVPSGMNSTTGETPGIAIKPERTLTLALPKTGLHEAAGELYLADIGIPPEAYHPLGLDFAPFFGNRYWIKLKKGNGVA